MAWQSGLAYPVWPSLFVVLRLQLGALPLGGRRCILTIRGGGAAVGGLQLALAQLANLVHNGGADVGGTGSVCVCVGRCRQRGRAEQGSVGGLQVCARVELEAPAQLAQHLALRREGKRGGQGLSCGGVEAGESNRSHPAQQRKVEWAHNAQASHLRSHQAPPDVREGGWPVGSQV